MNYDIAIIGGGPAGYTAAERAANYGLKTVLFEDKELGGVCLNEGCIPTKTLLYSAKTYDHAKEAKKYGISVGELEFDFKRIQARKKKVVKKLTAGVAFKMSSSGVKVVNERVHIEGESNELFNLKTDSGETFSSKYLLLSTGSSSAIPPITGLDQVDYWTSTEALEAKELPKSIVIIGGGVIGIEFASFFNSMGTEVTVVEMLPEILGPMDKETAAMLRKEYDKKGVQFHLNTKVTKLLPEGVEIEKEGQTSLIKGEKILLSVGRRANTEGFGLEKLAIQTEKPGVVVNEFMQTSHPRVYAAGDITGRSMLAHTAIRESEVAIDHIVGNGVPMSYEAVPGVVYTNPEIAGVGKTEEELTKAGKYFRTIKLPMAYSGRFIAENEGGNGLCKIIVDENERILGCHILGNPASEIIYGMGMAIDNGETLSTLSRHIYPHPTVAEIVHEAIQM